MHERVDEVSVGDRRRGAREELEVVPVAQRPALLLDARGVRLEVVLLDHERDDRVVLEVVVELVVERLAVQRPEALGARELRVEREGRLERRLLVLCAEALALVEGHGVLRELPGGEHVGDEAQVALRGDDELVHDLGGDLELLAEGDREHARADRLHGGLRKRHVERGTVQRLHLGVAAVVADADDRHLRLADQRIDRADAAAVAAGHAVDLVHDDHRAVGDRDVGAGRGAPALDGAVADRVGERGLEQLLAARVARIQLEHLVALEAAHEVHRRRLADARRPRDEHRTEGVCGVRARLLEVRLARARKVAQPRLQLVDVGLVPDELAQLLGRILARPQLARRRVRLGRERACCLLDLLLLVLHLLHDLGVERLGAALGDQRQEAVLGERAQLVLLDHLELLRAGVLAEDHVRGLGRGRARDLCAVALREVHGVVAAQAAQLAGEHEREAREAVGRALRHGL